MKLEKVGLTQEDSSDILKEFQGQRQNRNIPSIDLKPDFIVCDERFRLDVSIQAQIKLP